MRLSLTTSCIFLFITHQTGPTDSPWPSRSPPLPAPPPPPAPASFPPLCWDSPSLLLLLLKQPRRPRRRRPLTIFLRRRPSCSSWACVQYGAIQMLIRK